MRGNGLKRGITPISPILPGRGARGPAGPFGYLPLIPFPSAPLGRARPLAGPLSWGIESPCPNPPCPSIPAPSVNPLPMNPGPPGAIVSPQVIPLPSSISRDIPSPFSLFPAQYYPPGVSPIPIPWDGGLSVGYTKPVNFPTQSSCSVP